MTTGYGLGLLVIGMFLIMGAGIIIFLLTNRKDRD
jgi:hypothetical protein